MDDVLEQLVLKGHIGLWLETNAGTEDVNQSGALLAQGIDDRGAGRGQGSLEHVTENAQDAVEALVVFTLAVGLPADTGHHLGEHNQIDDQGRSQKRVLTNVEQADGLVATHEDLSVVLIQSTLVVADSRHVLDDDSVVGVLILLIENVVGRDHVIHNVGLGDLLRAELLLGAQVLAVVVAQVVVAGNGGKLDTSVDQEVNESRLHLGLARLEVITANESTTLLGQLKGTRDKGVLGRAVDERSVLENRGHSKHGGRSNLQMTGLDGVYQVVGSVVDTGNDVGVPLSVGSPHDNHLIQAVLSLEVANILLDLLDVSPASLVALDDIVGTVFLVGSDKVGVVDTRQRLHLGHLLADLVLEGGLQHLSTVHGLGEIEAADIPTANGQVVRVDHGEQVVEGDVDLLAGLSIRAQLDSGAHDDRTVVVGGLLAIAGLPGDITTVGQDTSSYGGTVVSTPTDQHHTHLANLAVDLEVVVGGLGSGNQLVVRGAGDLSSLIGVLRLDLVFGIDDIGGLDSKEGRFLANRPVQRAIGSIRASVRGHCVHSGMNRRIDSSVCDSVALTDIGCAVRCSSTVG